MKPPRCPECEKPLSLCLCGKLPKITSPLPILVLQHPQEKREVLSTVPFLKLMVENLTLKRGLSTANLTKALGAEAGTITPSEWVVFYLGSKDSIQKGSPPITFIKPKDKKPAKISGLIFIDGSWAQAKTLWWRNSWLLKCSRAALNPKKPSLYGKHRKEPRPECLSTLESVGFAVSNLTGETQFEETLNAALVEFLGKLKTR